MLSRGQAAWRTQSLLDIGHESLIRQWRRLSAWVDAEAESAAEYVRLADAARRHENGDAALLWEPDLQKALQWQGRERPSEAWAARYSNPAETSMQAGTDFHLAVAFLRDSRKAWDDAQERRRKREQDEHRRALDEARREAETRAARADADRAGPNSTWRSRGSWLPPGGGATLRCVRPWRC